jgi:hypothetical protein
MAPSLVRYGPEWRNYYFNLKGAPSAAWRAAENSTANNSEPSPSDNGHLTEPSGIMTAVPMITVVAVFLVVLGSVCLM